MRQSCLVSLIGCVLALCAVAPSARAVDGRVGLHVIRLEPSDDDAKKYSDAAWGGNLEALVVPARTGNALAFGLGLEIVQLDSETIEFRDRVTGLRVEQQTHQDYFRVYTGARIGHQGHGFLRPYAGANIALNVFTIDTDVVIPDDSDRENEIRQDLESQTESAFGFDIVAGVELNFSDKWYLDFGAKYIEAFNVPQQLGEDAETIYPSYIQIYVGGGITFGLMESLEE